MAWTRVLICPKKTPKSVDYGSWPVTLGSVHLVWRWRSWDTLENAADNNSAHFHTCGPSWCPHREEEEGRYLTKGLRFAKGALISSSCKGEGGKVRGLSKVASKLSEGKGFCQTPSPGHTRGKKESSLFFFFTETLHKPGRKSGGDCKRKR